MNDDEFDLLADAVLEVLGDGRPRTLQAITDELEQRGHELGSDPLDVIDDVLMADGLGPLLLIGEDDEWVYLPPLLLGRTFTHRVTALEVEHDCLSLDIDMQSIALLQEDERYKSLTDGTPLTDVMTTIDAEMLEQRGIPVEAVGVSAWLLPAGTYAVSGYADYGIVVFAPLLVAGWWLARSSRDLRTTAAVLWAGLGTLLAVALNQPLMNGVAERRPYASIPHVLVLISRSSDYSFPSDHATMAGAIAASPCFANRRLGLLAWLAARPLLTRLLTGLAETRLRPVLTPAPAEPAVSSPARATEGAAT